MQSITLKNIPEEIHQSLKIMARIHHRSLNNEIITCLERYTHHDQSQTQSVLEKARFNRSKISTVIKAKDIELAINEGRK
jgi:antitoxin FitA